MAAPSRLSTGEAFIGPSASDHNAFVDVWEAWRRKGDFRLARRVGGTNALRLLALNTTGAAIDAVFPVLEIAGPVYSAANRADVVHETISLQGKTPTATATMSDLVIVQSRITAGGLRPAVVMGPTWCTVDVTDDAHTHVEPKVGDNTQLASASSGSVKIVWKETGTGSKKALIILGGGGGGGGDNVRYGKTQAAGISAADGDTLGSGTVDRYDTSDRPNTTDTGEDDTVYNFVDDAIGGNTKILYVRDIDGTWLVAAINCPQGG